MYAARHSWTSTTILIVASEEKVKLLTVWKANQKAIKRMCAPVSLGNYSEEELSIAVRHKRGH